jgi:hypothetical protein
VVVTQADGTQIAGNPSNPLVNFPDDSHLKVDVYPSFGVVVSLDTPTQSGTFQLADVCRG